ncbi:MAG TPA: hypothetical protein V6D17_06030 [Candidatus Obscuribacterales bacterium]
MKLPPPKNPSTERGLQPMNATAHVSHIAAQVHLIRQAAREPFSKAMDELRPANRRNVLKTIKQLDQASVAVMAEAKSLRSRS